VICMSTMEDMSQPRICRSQPRDTSLSLHSSARPHATISIPTMRITYTKELGFVVSITMYVPLLARLAIARHS
jgi:hypothetical protein